MTPFRGRSSAAIHKDSRHKHVHFLVLRAAAFAAAVLVVRARARAGGCGAGEIAVPCYDLVARRGLAWNPQGILIVVVGSGLPRPYRFIQAAVGAGKGGCVGGGAAVGRAAGMLALVVASFGAPWIGAGSARTGFTRRFLRRVGAQVHISSGGRYHGVSA